MKKAASGDLVTALQWGRLMDEAESPLNGTASSGAYTLQWGRLMDEAESTVTTFIADGTQVASMGPPHG